MVASAAAGDLALFSGYAQEAPLRALADIGAQVTHHDHAWLRGVKWDEGQRLGVHVALGSPMVDDGLLKAPVYESWLRGITRDGPVSYVPHHRESRAAVARWGQLPGVRVVRSSLPGEVALLADRGVRTVSALPSPELATLALLLGREVELRVTDVPGPWLTSRADAVARALMADMAPRALRTVAA